MIERVTFKTTSNRCTVVFSTQCRFFYLLFEYCAKGSVSHLDPWAMYKGRLRHLLHISTTSNLFNANVFGPANGSDGAH